MIDTCVVDWCGEAKTPGRYSRGWLHQTTKRQNWKYFGKYFDDKRQCKHAFPITSSCSQSSYLQMMNIKSFEESIAVINTYHEMRQRADEKLARGEERF